MTKLGKVISTLVLAFIMVSLLSYILFYDFVDRFSFEYVQRSLIGTKEQVQQALEKRSNDDWHEIATTLSVELGVPIYVDSRNGDTFAKEQLEEFERYTGGNGILDAAALQVYFPVSQDYVLTVDGVSNNTWIAYVTETFAWILGFLTSVFVVIYFHRQDQQKLRALSDVFKLNVSAREAARKDVVIEDIVELAASLVKQQQQKSQSIEQLLVTQRDLLHGVAHEFRSPMARIQFALDMLEEAAPDEQIQLQKTMTTALLDLDGLVKELLYYARLKDESTPISLTQFELADAVQSAIEKVQPFYPHIDFQSKASAEQMISADQNLIHRMLVNLLRNAGRFANRKCRIHWHADETNLCIIIEDDGMGIPPGKTERIFEPFTRLDPSRSRDSGGCGLGLAIVASIVAKHQGQIRLLPHEPGDNRLCGACFELQFPV